MEKIREELPEEGSVEERILARAAKGVVLEWKRSAEGERYSGVELYDPVLRSHCRIQ